MKETDSMTGVRTCPKCGRTYSEVPVLSRADNKTRICPDCGTRESLESLGVDEKEQEEILTIIHRNTGGMNGWLV